MTDLIASVDCASGEAELRPMTADEQAQRQLDADQAAKDAAAPAPTTADLIVAAVMAAVPTANQGAVVAAIGALTPEPPQPAPVSEGGPTL